MALRKLADVLERLIDDKTARARESEPRRVVGRNDDGTVQLQGFYGECVERGPVASYYPGQIIEVPAGPRFNLKGTSGVTAAAAAVAGLVRFVYGLDPNVYTAGESYSVDLTGVGFAPGMAVQFLLPGPDHEPNPDITVTAVEVVDLENAIVEITVAPEAPALEHGSVKVGQALLADAYTVVPLLSITALDPAIYYAGESYSVAVTGSGFVEGMVLRFLKPGAIQDNEDVIVDSITVESPTTATVELAATETAIPRVCPAAIALTVLEEAYEVRTAPVLPEYLAIGITGSNELHAWRINEAGTFMGDIASKTLPEGLNVLAAQSWARVSPGVIAFHYEDTTLGDDISGAMQWTIDANTLLYGALDPDDPDEPSGLGDRFVLAAGGEVYFLVARHPDSGFSLVPTKLYQLTESGLELVTSQDLPDGHSIVGIMPYEDGVQIVVSNWSGPPDAVVWRYHFIGSAWDTDDDRTGEDFLSLASGAAVSTGSVRVVAPAQNVILCYTAGPGAHENALWEEEDLGLLSVDWGPVYAGVSNAGDEVVLWPLRRDADDPGVKRMARGPAASAWTTFVEAVVPEHPTLDIYPIAIFPLDEEP